MAAFLGWLPQSRKPCLNESIVPSGSFLPSIHSGSSTDHRERALWSDNEEDSLPSPINLKKWRAECEADITSILGRHPQGFGNSKRSKPRCNQQVAKLPTIRGACPSRPQSQITTSDATDRTSESSKTHVEDSSYDFDSRDPYLGLMGMSDLIFCRGDHGKNLRLREEQHHDMALAREHAKQQASRKSRKGAKAWQRRASKPELQNIPELQDVTEEDEETVEAVVTEHGLKIDPDKGSSRVGKLPLACPSKNPRSKRELLHCSSIQKAHADTTKFTTEKRDSKVKDRMKILKRLRKASKEAQRMMREEEETAPRNTEIPTGSENMTETGSESMTEEVGIDDSAEQPSEIQLREETKRGFMSKYTFEFKC